MINIKNVYTVGQLNSYIKNMFTQDYLLQALFVKGEVSNCKYHSSGHIYFTLKDPKGCISCVMFASNRSGLSFHLQEGQQVIVGGMVDVYERDGKYQMYAKQIQLDGQGVLYEKFEQLKQELEELGMFAPEYKQPIPQYIRTLGVVTASTGAAVRDIMQIAKRRNPYVQIILYSAIVQGAMAVPSIVKGIKELEKQGVDVMIVGRGGGSIEDLWAFNERDVAQAVFDCSIPIISAVGHETDTTIIDFVSDLRAPTPSAAAELAVYDIHALFERIDRYRNGVTVAMNHRLKHKKDELRLLEMRLKHQSPIRKVNDQKNYLLRLEERTEQAMTNTLKNKRHALAIYIEKLKGLSPLEKINSGYSYLEKEGEEHIRSIKQLQVGDSIRITLKDGKAQAEIKSLMQTEG